jgi:circadian clock protein KaiC
VIDGLSGLLKTLTDPERNSDFFTALANELRMRGVTTVFSLEMRDVIGDSISIPQLGVSETTDNIICLRYVELQSKLHRLLSILKVSDGAYDSGIYEFQITDRGMTIEAPIVNAEALLTGVARPQPMRGAAPALQSITDE